LCIQCFGSRHSPIPKTELQKISRRAFALCGPHRAPKLIAPSGSECERKLRHSKRNKRNVAMRTQSYVRAAPPRNRKRRWGLSGCSMSGLSSVRYRCRLLTLVFIPGRHPPLAYAFGTHVAAALIDELQIATLIDCPASGVRNFPDCPRREQPEHNRVPPNIKISRLRP
jgi:hypothetical protein